MQVRLLPPSRKRRFEENNGPVRFRGFPSQRKADILASAFSRMIKIRISHMAICWHRQKLKTKVSSRGKTRTPPGFIVNVKLNKNMQIVKRAGCSSRLGTVIR